MDIKQLRLQTGYLVEPIALRRGLPIHKVEIASIAGQEDREGAPRVELSLDPNRCTIDSFGDPKACTRMAPVQLVATVALLAQCDGKRLFALNFEEPGPALRLALLPACGNGETIIARLLVFGESGEVAAILPLQTSGTGCVVV